MGYKKGEKLKSAFDTYTIEFRIGGGGSGEVFQVRDSENVAHAAKILDLGRANTKRLKRFKNEIYFCARSTHRNIVQVLGSGVADSGATFYVMPAYSGTLRDLISGGIAPARVLPYFGQILDGVEFAHLQGVWHRDLKPENILLSRADDLLVVADFGIAHFEEDELLTAVETRDDERLANFVYSAPEQRTRGQQVDGKADIYALGLILNEMFSQRVPQGTSFRSIADVAADYGYLDDIVDLMLKQDPFSRPSIRDVKRELIARGNQFLSLQCLNSLRTEVVPETEVDDPLVRSPVELTEVDYRSPNLIFKLSVAPPPNWVMAFQNPRGSWASYQGT
jgi:serine/threonine protein kinase